jgi:type I restriction enzyme S subunit
MKFVKLGTVCKLRNGYAFKSNNFIEIGVPIIRISNINGNLVTPEKAVRTNYEKIFDNYKIVNGDILIAMSGATTGKFGIYNSDEIAYQNQRVGCFKILDDSKLNEIYLLQVLNIVKPTIEKKANGGAQPNISANAIEDIIIPLPSIDDQIRIAEILTKAESLITQRKESILMLDELLKSSFLEMFGDPIRNEKGWKKDSFENLVDQDCPLTYGIVQPGDEFPNGVPIIRPVDLTKTKIDRIGLKLIDPKISDKFKRTVLRGKEILMCVRGTTGIVALASEELVNCNVTRGIVPIWFSDNYNKFFAFGLLKTKAINNEIQNLTYGATLKQINLSDLRKIRLINPPIELQNQYAAIAEKIEELIKEYQASLKELLNMYGVLSQKAFTGELLDSEEIKIEKKDDTVMEEKPDEIIDIKNYTKEKKGKVDITNMTFADYVGFPEEFQIRDEKWISMFLGQDEFYQFLLKDHFKDVSFNLGDIEMKLNNFFYHNLDMDFDNEAWRSAIFGFMKADPPLIIQRFDEESATIKLELTDEAYKA